MASKIVTFRQTYTWRLTAFWNAAVYVIFGFYTTNQALAQASQVYTIDERPSEQDRLIARKYISDSINFDDISAKHIKDITILEEIVGEQRRILIYYSRNDKSFVAFFNASGNYYYPDVLIDDCAACVWVRFGNLNTQDADLVVTRDDIFLSVGNVSKTK